MNLPVLRQASRYGTAAPQRRTCARKIASTHRPAARLTGLKHRHGEHISRIATGFSNDMDRVLGVILHRGIQDRSRSIRREPGIGKYRVRPLVKPPVMWCREEGWTNQEICHRAQLTVLSYLEQTGEGIGQAQSGTGRQWHARRASGVPDGRIRCSLSTTDLSTVSHRNSSGWRWIHIVTGADHLCL